MERYIKNGIIKSQGNIIIKKDGLQYINPTKDMILADGWSEYIASDKEEIHVKTIREIVEEIVIKQWNKRNDITNEEAVDYKAIVYNWEKYIDKEILEGQIVSYDDKLWRAKTTHMVKTITEPSVDETIFFEVIE